MNTTSSPVSGRKNQAEAATKGSGRRFWRWFKRGLTSLLILIIVLPFIGATYQFAADRIDQHRFLAPGQLTESGGYMLHIHCVGEGSPTVILESGLGGTSLDWSLVQPALADTTRVCSYDRAGLGWSEPNPANIARTSQQIAGELHTLLTNTGITGPYVLVGLSAGGMHVERFANQYPDEVLGLILVDPTPARLMAGFSDQEREVLLPSLTQFNLIQKLEPFGLLRLLPLPGSEALANLPEETREVIRAVNLKTGATTALYEEAAGFEASIMQIASLPSLPQQIPLTVIWHGIPAEPLELEPLAEAALRELTERSEYGRFVIVEDSGHYITFDRPDVVIAEIKALLNILSLGSQVDMLKLAKAR